MPIIRAPKTGAAALIAEAVNGLLVDYLRDQESNINSPLNSPSSSFAQRPVLLLLDRQMDLSVLLSHPWTYQVGIPPDAQALLHDMLGMELNHIQLKTKAGETVSYDLEEEKDTFMRENAAQPIPEVAGALSKQLDEVKAEKEEFKRVTGRSDLTDDGYIGHTESAVALICWERPSSLATSSQVCLSCRKRRGLRSSMQT